MNSRLLCALVSWWFALSLSAASPKVTALTPKQMLTELSRRPSGNAADALGQRIAASFGRQGLEKGKAKAEDTTVAWVVLATEPARVVKADGTEIGRLIPLGGGVQALALALPNFQDFDWRIEAAGQNLGGGHLRIEHYEYTADSLPQPGVPKGRLEQFEWRSKIFTNTVRNVTVYIPSQYHGNQPACVMVWQDGTGQVNTNGQMRAPVVFDNLIHKRQMPVTVGIFVDPGRRPDQPPKGGAANRGFEYDSLGDTYTRFILEEILPEVTKRYSLNLRTDPAGRAIAGGSSGGICAFTVAWERPDQFGKVLSWVGSFVDLRGGHVYPHLIRKTERKPIRVYLLDGDNDLDNPFGHWPLANQMMAASLKYMGYDYRFDYGHCFHGSKAMGASLPDALRWLWRDAK